MMSPAAPTEVGRIGSLSLSGSTYCLDSVGTGGLR